VKRVPRPSHFKPGANLIPQDRRTKLGLSAEQAAFHGPGSGIVVQVRLIDAVEPWLMNSPSDQ